MSSKRSATELKTREWYSVAGSSRVLPVCKTGAFPSGSRSLVPEAGFEPALELVLSKRPLPLGYSGNWCSKQDSNLHRMRSKRIVSTDWTIGAWCPMQVTILRRLLTKEAFCH